MQKNQINVPIEQLIPIITEQFLSGKSITISPHGKSMLPLLREGKDSVTISPIDRPLKKYDIIFYKRDNGQYVLHRIVEIGNSYTCIGDNQFIYEKNVKNENIMGVVTYFSRKEKVISVNNIFYKSYCLLWQFSRPTRHFIFRVINKIKSFFK